MKKLFTILLVTIVGLLLVGCTPTTPSTPQPTPDEGDNGTQPTPTREYTTETYQNPLRFHKQDGSLYDVAVADPDIYHYDSSSMIKLGHLFAEVLLSEFLEV